MANGAPMTENMDVKFKKPKQAYYEKKEVFLPKEGEKYNNPKGNQQYNSKQVTYSGNSEQSNQVLYSQMPVQTAKQTQQHNGLTYEPQQVVYMQSNNQNMAFGQNPISEARHVQSTLPEANTYKRIIHKLNGEVVEENIQQ